MITDYTVSGFKIAATSNPRVGEALIVYLTGQVNDIAAGQFDQWQIAAAVAVFDQYGNFISKAQGVVKSKNYFNQPTLNLRDNAFTDQMALNLGPMPNGRMTIQAGLFASHDDRPDFDWNAWDSGTDVWDKLQGVEIELGPNIAPRVVAFDLLQPVVTPIPATLGQAIHVSIPILSKSDMAVPITGKIRIAEGSVNPTPGVMVEEVTFGPFDIAPNQQLSVDFDTTAKGSGGNKDIEVWVYVGQEKAYNHFDDVFTVVPPGGGTGQDQYHTIAVGTSFDQIDAILKDKDIPTGDKVRLTIDLKAPMAKFFDLAGAEQILEKTGKVPKGFKLLDAHSDGWTTVVMEAEAIGAPVVVMLIAAAAIIGTLALLIATIKVDSTGLADLPKKISDTAKWLGIGAIAVGGAIVVSSVVPKRSVR
jgi:hypothetical protein